MLEGSRRSTNNGKMKERERDRVRGGEGVGEEGRKREHNIETVSYTHLDVYKRQD